ncbi:response regulator [Flavobacterium sp. W22_SRS_FP1]|uniref:response regulator n=1 Tax=Flavobacterium sp. W22_SRS_FP1 TaxID=3240276 RepID=UPI003F936BD1
MQKILIIDDEKNLRETLCELLTHGGFEVHEAQNGQQGIEQVKQIKPNLIICDIMMPILDGYSFLKQHQKSIYSDIPVLLISAKTEQPEELISLGIKGYLSKPFKYNELISKINYALAK